MTSWLQIQAGWVVADGEGTRVGVVSEVVGDPDADIFNGIRYESESGDSRYIAAARVAAVQDGRVALDGREPAGGGDPDPQGAELARDRSG